MNAGIPSTSATAWKGVAPRLLDQPRGARPFKCASWKLAFALRIAGRPLPAGEPSLDEVGVKEAGENVRVCLVGDVR
jgi:hypothetical protein